MEGYKNEIIKASEAKRAQKFMKQHFDEQSESLYGRFVNTDPKDIENLQFIVIHHRVLMDEQQYLQNAIDTGRLAQIELDKLEK